MKTRILSLVFANDRRQHSETNPLRRLRDLKISFALFSIRAMVRTNE
jgi:hypothetical protein